MAEHVGGEDLFGSGGHRWAWAPRAVAAKTFGTVGVEGVGRMVLVVGPRAALVEGVLKAAGTSRAAADADLTALEEAIEALAASGEAVPWEDDHGHAGETICVETFERAGPRQYGVGGTSAWQFYRCRLLELTGGIAGA